MQVYRHPYQQKLQLQFTISLGDSEEEVVTEPIGLIEVNGRTSFEIRGNKQLILWYCFCVLLSFTGLKNGYVLPDSKDAVSIQFEVGYMYNMELTTQPFAF